MDMSAVDQDDLMRWAALIQQDATSLESVSLDPDGIFQTRKTTMATVHQDVVDDLAAGFRCRGPDDFPLLICGWGKSRVGSTALSNIFGMAGLPSYYQPLKAMLRNRLNDIRKASWCPPSASLHSHLFSKETAGPYLLAECLFIPQKMLIEAGYPPDKLHLLLLDRQPVDCLNSWFARLSGRISRERLLRHHVLAALNVVRVEGYARRQGIPVTHYVHEASKDAVASAQALFLRLGLGDRFAEREVTDWEDAGDLDSDRAKVIYPDEPSVFAVPGLHGAETGYRFQKHEVRPLGDDVMDLLTRHGLFESYQRSV
ncbi:MAG TPA: sulfotransferase family protein, partial [Telmatospirillum sp.]|nr:sulfotransferase family protein [Telmatospirillum sp.]